MAKNPVDGRGVAGRDDIKRAEEEVTAHSLWNLFIPRFMDMSIMLMRYRERYGPESVV